MGCAPSATLAWGVVVTAEYGEHPFYDVEEGWKEFPADSRLEWIQFGHYLDEDQRAILTFKGSYRVSGDAWDAGVAHLDHGPGLGKHNDMADGYDAAEAIREAAERGLDLSDGAWLVVASYG